ncbi:MAG: PglZ domain-containing protein, partial [Limisphaerales bacterium]
ASFPDGDGDDFASLCRRAKPDHVPEINRLFEDGEPGFEMVDALDEGGSWPKLKTLLGANSPKEILLGIMSPKAEQEEALKQDATWVSEAREFFVRSLGYRLKTKGQTRPSIAEELWRVILFSEFAFDSAGHVPAALETVPKVGIEARSLVYDLCDELRKHEDHKDAYRCTAQEIEAELSLAERSRGMTYLGERDTFSFEERFYLQRVVDRALADQLDAAREICNSRKRSIWLGQEDRLAEWSLASRALELLDAAGRLNAPKFPTLEAIVHGYASTWRELDRHHREMEQAINQWQGDHDGLDVLVAQARQDYFRSVEALQAEFVRLVAAEGWPASGGQLLWNCQVFSKVVAPAMDAGERVAYFLVDSLRYELGVEVEKQLSDKSQVTLRTVCAQLPTYTEVGMASLMPDAESALKLVVKDGKLVTTLGGELATAPATRFAYLQSCKGDQCGDIDLDELVRQKKPKVLERVRLLVVRTRDIDAIAHDSPHQVLQVIPALVRQIIRGLAKVAELGFDKAVIATDHGFILWHEQGAGNVAARPAGKWLIEKPRCVLGQGESDSVNLVMSRGEMGIPGEFEHYAAPRTLVPYSRGQLYYHEGLSLQECVLPCLTVQLVAADKKARKKLPEGLTLTYRQGKSDRITSRRPVVDLSWVGGDLFAEEHEIEVVVEATDSKGILVGWVGSGQSVNPATGGVRIKPGAALAVGLRMEDSFSGGFVVRVLDPSTNVLLGSLNLKTAYLE